MYKEQNDYKVLLANTKVYFNRRLKKLYTMEYNMMYQDQEYEYDHDYPSIYMYWCEESCRF